VNIGEDCLSVSKNDFGVAPLALAVGKAVGDVGMASVPMLGPIAITDV